MLDYDMNLNGSSLLESVVVMQGLCAQQYSKNAVRRRGGTRRASPHVMFESGGRV